MACTPVRADAIGELVAGRLDEGALGEFLDHLETCEPCSEELDAIAAVVATTGSAPAVRLTVGPSETRGLVMPGGAPVVYALLAAAAAVLLLVVAVGGRGGEDALPPLARLAVTTPLAAPESALRSTPGEGDPLAAALEPYAAGDHAGAAARLAALAVGDDRALVRLYLGIARLQCGELDGATEALRAASERGVGTVRDRALWYLANARLAADDREGALEPLAVLVGRAGPYQVNAEELVEAIRAVAVE